MTLESKLEKDIVLVLFKEFTSKYNPSSIAKLLGKSRMGAFKALKQLEKKGIVKGETLCKARFYNLVLDS